MFFYKEYLDDFGSFERIPSHTQICSKFALYQSMPWSILASYESSKFNNDPPLNVCLFCRGRS